ncbi:MAG: pyridoxal-phosphate-dependent aminotransferase family protein [Thermoplasmataceae archaeon]
MLLLPGPVEVPRSVRDAATYLNNHRSADFKRLVGESEILLNRFLGAERTVMTTGSGTLAVEAMIFSFLSPSEKVLAVSSGEFGNRMVSSLRRRGCDVTEISRAGGSALKFSDIEEAVDKNKGITSLLLVHNETGNGTAIRDLGSITRRSRDIGLKILVDSVSGFCGYDLDMEEFGIDAVATCSQKGLASLPGVGIVSMSESGLEHLGKKSDMPSYIDLSMSLKYLDRSETAFTPSVGTFAALHRALEILGEETLGRRIARHKACSEYLRKKLTANGISVFGNADTFSDTVVTFYPKHTSQFVAERLLAGGIQVARGMGEIHNNTVRVGTMGMINSHFMSKFLNEYFLVDNVHDTSTLEEMPKECTLPDFLLEEVDV